MKRHAIRFGPDGRGRFIFSDELARIGRAVGRISPARASHVEPDGDGWSADMSPADGPVLLAEDGMPFTTRAAALDAERAWLEERAIPLPIR